MPRGGLASDSPGCQQAQRRLPQAGCGIPAAPSQNTKVGDWNRGRFLLGLEPEVKVLGARSSTGSEVSQSQATPSPVSISAVTSPSPLCVCVQIPPMRTPRTQVNLGSSVVAHLHTKSQSEVPGSPSSRGKMWAAGGPPRPESRSLTEEEVS